LFIFALFALGVLVATEIVVSNSIFKSLSEVGSPSTRGNQREEGLSGFLVGNFSSLFLGLLFYCTSYVCHIVAANLSV
jgi:hypothetical protein